MTGSHAAPEPLYSVYADEEELSELIECFVEELPERAASAEQAWASGDKETLRMLAHQLKGSAGSYGFQLITDAAAVLEIRVREGSSTEEIEQALQAMSALCLRAAHRLPERQD